MKTSIKYIYTFFLLFVCILLFFFYASKKKFKTIDKVVYISLKCSLNSVYKNLTNSLPENAISNCVLDVDFDCSFFEKNIKEGATLEKDDELFCFKNKIKVPSTNLLFVIKLSPRYIGGIQADGIIKKMTIQELDNLLEKGVLKQIKR